MIKTKALIPLALFFSLIGCQNDDEGNPNNDTSIRYFEFVASPVPDDLKDASVIAATSDPAVIQKVLEELKKPADDRFLHPSGTIDFGDGGYNHNEDHWFKWHYKLNEWDLAEFSIEVCDGRPFSDIDQDPEYWVNTVGAFCPWGMRLSREVEQP